MQTLPLYFNARTVKVGEDLPDPDFYYLTENRTEVEERMDDDETIYEVQAIVMHDTLQIST